MKVERGERFNYLRLTYALTKRSADGHRMGWWECDCGKFKAIAVSRVRTGKTKSCGCFKRVLSSLCNTRHGFKGTPTYTSWQSMKRRCLRECDKDFPRWGAKGVGIESRWMRFENFLEDMGVRPFGTTLDRINGGMGYGPGNCRWATAKEQSRNRKCFVAVSTPLGVMPLIDYAARVGLTKGAAHLRLNRGRLEGCARV